MKKLLLINCLIFCSFVSYAENLDFITELENNDVISVIENELQTGISARNNGKASGEHLFNNVKTMSNTKVVYQNESNLESRVIEPNNQLTEAVQALGKQSKPNNLESASSSNKTETNNSINQEVNTVASKKSGVTLNKRVTNNQLPMKNPSDTTEENNQPIHPKADGQDSENVTGTPSKSSEESKKCLALLQGFKEKYDGDCLNNLPNGIGIAEGKDGIYEGKFKNGQFHGKGKLTYFDTGETYNGDFVNGVKQGQGYIVDNATGNTRLANFENNQFMSWVYDRIVNYRDDPTDVGSSSINIPRTKDFGSSSLYIGKTTPYGTVQGIDKSFVTIEKMIYDSDGYRRSSLRKYPIALFIK